MNIKFTMFALILLPFSVWGNALVISSVERLEAPNRDQVRFNISWQNSWFVGGTPGNHDAVWVFVKFKPCEISQPQFSHALLSTDMATHTFSAGVTAAKPILTTDRYGEGSGHNTGVLIRRRVIGLGNINNETVTLTIVGATDGALFDPDVEYNIEVLGVEMVQIPEGGFSYGDNSTFSSHWGQHGQSNIGAENSTYSISVRWNTNITVTARYPKGVWEFYVMKYEISQGQYVDFLNNIGSMGSQRQNTPVGTNRYTITIGANGFEANEPNRACNFISINDMLAYLDWACLRPMSEFEYEKASKGGAFQDGAFAWGLASFIEALNISTPEDGTETVITENANLHYLGTNLNILNAADVSQGAGPLGCGIFARNGSENRITSGATYYGVMEMSGNVMELCVSANNGITGAGTIYEGVWGDGILTGFGAANTAGWPAVTRNHYGWRGGGWNSPIDECRISNRRWIANYDSGFNASTVDVNTRHNQMGGRGVR